MQDKTEFETVGWANLSNSNKALIITLDGKRVGIISLTSLGKTLKGDIKASPIVLPVEDKVEEVKIEEKKYTKAFPELKEPIQEAKV